MRRKGLSYLLIFVLTVGLFAGCGGKSQTPSTTESSKAPVKKIKVALITSAGGLGDRSFNDAAWQGFKKAEEAFGVEIKVIEPQAVSDYQTSITSVAESGFDFIMAVGNDWQDILNTAAPRYPNIKFSGINVKSKGDNIGVAQFADHEGSYLAGAFAAMMSKSGIIGFVGGADVPAINRFCVGFEEGAKYAKPDIKVLKTYVGSFNDPGKGKEFALQLISQNADIIFHAAGKTGEGLFEAVKSKDGVYAIGVDQDQDYIAPGKILTSMQKKVDAAAFDYIKSIKEGTFTSGIKVYGIKEGGVGLSEMKYTKDKIPSDVLNRIAEISKKISSGEIKVTDVFKK